MNTGWIGDRTIGSISARMVRGWSSFSVVALKRGSKRIDRAEAIWEEYKERKAKQKKK